MSTGDIIGVASVCIALIVLIASLLRDAANKKKNQHDEGAADAKLRDGFDLLNHKLENLSNKIDDLKTAPIQIAETAASTRSAHKRIDDLESKLSKLTDLVAALSREVSENRAHIKARSTKGGV